MKNYKKWMCLLFVCMMMLSCMPAYAASYQAGTYTGKGTGRGGELEVAVTVTDDAIAQIEVVSHNETPGLSDGAITTIPADVITYQSLAVDTVSGATMTSDALLEAISSALVSAGADIEVLKTKAIEVEKGEDTEYTTQVCIIGGGGAGLTAALTLAEGGIDVIVMEKTASLGGEAIRNGGLTFAAGSKVQKELGLADEYNTPEDLWKYWITINPDADEEMCLKMFAKTGEVVDWLTEDVGVRWDPELRAQGNDWAARNLTTADAEGGVGFMLPIINKLKNYDNVTFLMSTRGNHLLTNEQGDVIGATGIAKDGSTVTVHSDYVLMATGHYDSSEKWMGRFHPEIIDTVDYKLDVCTGDGLDMAEEIGINLKTCGYVGGHMLALKGLFVNDKGERFTNEAGFYGNMMKDLKANYGKTLSSYMIATQKNLDETNFITYMQDGAELNWKQIFEYGFEEDHRYGGLNNAGHTFKADTLEEVCALVNLPYESVQATVDQYNALCAAGEDSQFGKDAQYLVSLEEGPYYIYKLGVMYSQNEGGIDINRDYQPLRTDGSVVNGMYAIGIVANGELYRPNAYSGSGTNMCWAFAGGREVAEKIVETLAN